MGLTNRRVFDQIKKKLFGSSKVEGHGAGGPFATGLKKELEDFREKYQGALLHEISIPKMTETDLKYWVVKWVKEDGQHVAKHEILCEVETKKATLELESYVDGRVYLRMEPKKHANVGDLLCVIVENKI